MNKSSTSEYILGFNALSELQQRVISKIVPVNYEKNTSCSKHVRFRTIDGTCNTLNDPLSGSVHTNFARFTVKSDVDYESLPSAKKVARILKRNKKNKSVAWFNQLASSWIQFMIHDWFVHDKKTQKNKVTHWWDASQIYGSNMYQMSQVRLFEDGKIKLDDENELVYNCEDNKPYTGFADNFWVGLYTLHTVFHREHNYLCDQLKTYFPNMDDEELFQTTRHIIAAIIMKIHTIEWTNTLIMNKLGQLGQELIWYGINETIYRHNNNLEELENYNDMLYAYDKVNRYKGATKARTFSLPFNMLEEFVSVYRMHQLLPDGLRINKKWYPLRKLVFNDPKKYVTRKTSNHILNALGETEAHTLTLENYPRDLFHLKIPGTKRSINLAAFEIARDRSRGLPLYNDIRTSLNLPRLKIFEEMNPDINVIKKLKSLYKDIDHVDLMVGIMADANKLENFAFGTVAHYIFISMASRRIIQDRFFTENFNEETYTSFGMEYIHNTKFYDILNRHYPDIMKDKPTNPFLLW